MQHTVITVLGTPNSESVAFKRRLFDTMQQPVFPEIRIGSRYFVIYNKCGRHCFGLQVEKYERAFGLFHFPGIGLGNITFQIRIIGSLRIRAKSVSQHFTHRILLGQKTVERIASFPTFTTHTLPAIIGCESGLSATAIVPTAELFVRVVHQQRIMSDGTFEVILVVGAVVTARTTAISAGIDSQRAFVVNLETATVHVLMIAHKLLVDFHFGNHTVGVPARTGNHPAVGSTGITCQRKVVGRFPFQVVVTPQQFVYQTVVH